MQEHGLQGHRPKIHEDLKAALRYEARTEIDQIDKMRAEMAKEWCRKAEELEGARQAWVFQAESCQQPLVARLHGPFADWLSDEMDYSQKLGKKMCRGWKIVGDLDYCAEGTEDCEDVEERPTPDELWDARAETNAMVVGSLTPSECEEDLMKSMVTDTDLGAMTAPYKIEGPDDLEDIAVSMAFGLH